MVISSKTTKGVLGSLVGTPLLGSKSNMLRSSTDTMGYWQVTCWVLVKNHALDPGSISCGKNSRACWVEKNDRDGKSQLKVYVHDSAEYFIQCLLQMRKFSHQHVYGFLCRLCAVKLLFQLKKPEKEWRLHLLYAYQIQTTLCICREEPNSAW